jgi:hypothetical protein
MATVRLFTVQYERTFVECGKGLPGAISDGPPDLRQDELDVNPKPDRVIPLLLLSHTHRRSSLTGTTGTGIESGKGDSVEQV